MCHPSLLSFRRRGAVLALVGALCMVPAKGASQEVGVYYAGASSNLAEIGSPKGFGVFGRVTPTSLLSVRVSLYRQSERSVRMGWVCTQYIPEVNCREEAVRTDTEMGGLTITTGLRGRPFSRLELEGGSGVSLNRVRGDDETESGRHSSLFMHNSLQFGALVTVSGRVRPVLQLPLTLEAGLTHHQIWLRACAEEDWQYDPYCGTVGVRGGWIGISFHPGW